MTQTNILQSAIVLNILRKKAFRNGFGAGAKDGNDA
jgi:hypothetical protein